MYVILCGSYSCWPASTCLLKVDFIMSHSVKAASSLTSLFFTYVHEVGCNNLDIAVTNSILSLLSCDGQAIKSPILEASTTLCLVSANLTLNAHIYLIFFV